MKPFRLQSVLEYREMQKKTAQQKFADAQQREANLEAEIARERQNLINLHEKLQLARWAAHELQDTRGFELLDDPQLSVSRRGATEEKTV